MGCVDLSYSGRIEFVSQDAGRWRGLFDFSDYLNRSWTIENCAQAANRRGIFRERLKSRLLSLRASAFDLLALLSYNLIKNGGHYFTRPDFQFTTRQRGSNAQPLSAG